MASGTGAARLIEKTTGRVPANSAVLARPAAASPEPAPRSRMTPVSAREVPAVHGEIARLQAPGGNPRQFNEAKRSCLGDPLQGTPTAQDEGRQFSKASIAAVTSASGGLHSMFRAPVMSRPSLAITAMQRQRPRAGLWWPQRRVRYRRRRSARAGPPKGLSASSVRAKRRSRPAGIRSKARISPEAPDCEVRESRSG